jgi:hypothetical protein
VTTAKPSAPVVGFNHNVKYGDRVYHVQTEDSGLPHAHYITHLFVGGNIVASMKTSYADKPQDSALANLVRGLMEAQHKHMLKRLVAGEFKEQAARFSAHYEPGVLADGSNQASYVNTQVEAKEAPRKPAAPPPFSQKPAAKPLAPPVAAAPPPHVSPPPPVAPLASPPAQQIRRPPPNVSPAQRPAVPILTTPQAPVQRVVAPTPSQTPPPRIPGQPLPSVTRGPQPPPKPNAPPKMAPVAPPARPIPAPPPPSLFTDNPVEMPHDDLPTLFAEELISEKSLDEVILAFLSADLEPPK